MSMILAMSGEQNLKMIMRIFHLTKSMISEEYCGLTMKN